MHDRPFAAIELRLAAAEHRHHRAGSHMPGPGPYPGSVLTITILEMSLFIGALSSDPYQVEDAR